MRPHNNLFSKRISPWLLALLFILPPATLAAAQAPTQPPKPANPHTPSMTKQNGQYTLHANVSLVVLHATVLNNKGQMVDDLGKTDFQVSEDGTPQKLAVFSHSDIPVTMGIVIDDSGSMRPKRPAVNAAALDFVKTSNPDDQVFVVNFNDVYYLDTPGNFASNEEQLKAAVDKIDSRGGTALYDAVYASLDHLKLGNRDKRVLLVVTDGEDNSSRYTFDQLVRYAQQSNTEIYTIGLLGGDDSGGWLFKIHSGGDRHAAKILKDLAEATGGKAFFPKSLTQVNTVCEHIAHVIRDQYTLAYYPTNTAKDGTYRKVRVEAFMPHSHKRLAVRTKPGYYAPKAGELSLNTQPRPAGK